MNKSFQTFLNDGNPTDIPMRLGQLRIGDFLASIAKGGEVDAASRTVTDDVHTFVDSSGTAQYGIVLGVQVTAGGVTGPFDIIYTGTPVTTQVLLEATKGQPKLTFAAADAVTACRCHWVKIPTTRGDGKTWFDKLAEVVS
jgi:hypothetical protein